MNNTCVCCGAVIPEGRQVCPICERRWAEFQLHESKSDFWIFERRNIMEQKFREIINEGKKQGAPVEAINAELKAAGADFHLDPNGRKVTGWTDTEMTEGFRPGEPAEDVKHLHDYMKFSKEKAGTEEVVSVPGGKYRITWDEDGHPVKAVRL